MKITGKFYSFGEEDVDQYSGTTDLSCWDEIVEEVDEPIITESLEEEARDGYISLWDPISAMVLTLVRRGRIFFILLDRLFPPVR